MGFKHDADVVLPWGGSFGDSLPRRPLAAQPSPDRKHFYVLYEDVVVRVDRDLQQSKKVLSLEDSPVQLFEHPDNNHFYALHFDSSDVSVVDGASGKTVDGKAYYYVPIVIPDGAEYQKTFATFSEGARFLYVYNASTDDVTVIDTGSHKVVEKLPGGEDDFKTVNDGKLLCAVSPGYVRFFDVAKGFEMKVDYDGVNAEVLEIAGKNKAYLSRDLGKAVAVIDLDTSGELVDIPDTSGKVIQLVEYK